MHASVFPISGEQFSRLTLRLKALSNGDHWLIRTAGFSGLNIRICRNVVHRTDSAPYGSHANVNRHLSCLSEDLSFGKRTLDDTSRRAAVLLLPAIPRAFPPGVEYG